MKRLFIICCIVATSFMLKAQEDLPLSDRKLKKNILEIGIGNPYDGLFGNNNITPVGCNLKTGVYYKSGWNISATFNKSAIKNQTTQSLFFFEVSCKESWLKKISTSLGGRYGLWKKKEINKVMDFKSLYFEFIYSQDIINISVQTVYNTFDQKNEIKDQMIGTIKCSKELFKNISLSVACAYDARDTDRGDVYMILGGEITFFKSVFLCANIWNRDKKANLALGISYKLISED